MRPFLASLLLAVMSLLPCRAGEAATGVDVSLVADTTAIVAGHPFTAALQVHHQEGYHTYWLSPGSVGVPFKIDWKLPPGFTAGPIQWPVPQQVKMAIHPAHGYERDVMLLVEITPPAKLDASHITLEAKASWMACYKGCYPGNRTLTLDLPAAETAAASAQADAIHRTRAEIPVPLAGWDATVETAADAAEIRLKFTRQPGNSAAPAAPYFFSDDGQIASEPPQRIEVLPDGFRVIAPRDEYGPKGRKTLTGVLRADGPLAEGKPAYATVSLSYL